MRNYLLMLVALLLAVPAGASESYVDYARVIEARPVLGEKRLPVTKEVCDRPQDSVPPGDVRRQQPAATIGELIRADDRRRRPVCRTETRYKQQQQIEAWQVRYVYAGKTYTRRVREKPGDRIRVRIDLEAR
ncbi:MAG: hypothetical protein KJO54_00150 [Gammaproteobacteria bacterium]|nr:hypothetical protein [Gammaproteobacteria bacterium]